MHAWLQSLHSLILASQKNLLLSLEIVVFFWLVHIVNLCLGMRLNLLGILPRRARGLPGIVFSPFLHGNFEHLFFNSVAMFILIDLMLIYGLPIFIATTIIVILVCGFLVWCFARRGIHIGASGLMLGYWAFLLVNAYFQGGATAWVLAALCLYYLAGLGLSLIPGDAGTSFEAHIFGAIGGVVAVYTVPYFL